MEPKRLSDTPLEESFNLLLYGAAGSGKTTFAGTVGDRNLFVNNGSGIVSLRNKTFISKYGKINPLVIDVDTDDLEKGSTMYDSMQTQIEEAIEKYSDLFDVITIDDSTALSRSGMHKALAYNGMTGKSKTIAEAKKWNTIIPSVQDYGVEMGFTQSFIIDLLSIGKKYKKVILVLAHERHTYKKASSIGEQPVLVRVAPFFTGVDKNPDYIAGLFQNVWHTEVVGGGTQTFYRIRTVGDESLTAKTQYGGIFDIVEKDVTFPKVMEKIKNVSK